MCPRLGACCAVAVTPTLQASTFSNDHHSDRLFFDDIDVLFLVLAMQSRYATMFVSLHSAQ